MGAPDPSLRCVRGVHNPAALSRFPFMPGSRERWIASLLNHDSPLTRVVEFTWGLSAFGVAFSLALVWLLAGAINWQIKEATRLRG